MARWEGFKNAQRHLDAGGDPYEHVDLRLATRLGGALYLIGIAYVLIVLPLAPPDTLGGWAGVVVCLALAAVTAILLLRREKPLAPNLLLAFALVGITIAALLRFFGGAGIPLGQLLFLACLHAAAIHPAQRAVGVLGAATFVSLTPALYEHTSGAFFAATAGSLALTWSLGGVIMFWMTRTRRQRREAQRARDEADQLARVDALTGMGNRRALEEALPVAVAAARREDEPLSMIVADLDDFKRVNDSHGHHAGDDLIRTAARAFATAVRIPDPCFRFGGDEFVALLPGASLAECTEVAERICTAVALACRRPDGRPLRITAGCAELQEDERGEDLFTRADEQLLTMKASPGRVARAG